ncbi:MAG TPA: SDR family oxidoreductase [Solimonas sp.]
MSAAPASVLIVGAASAIAEAVARRFAADGARLFLVGRNPQRLEVIAADLRVRGAASVTVHALDANDFDAHEAMLAAAERALGGLDQVLIAHGTLPDQALCERDPQALQQALDSNGVSVVQLCNRIATRLQAQRRGTLAVISSVAGDRGRASNYVYGAAKAMVSAYTSGLRARLYADGVRVLTIKPGFVDTPMTQAFRKGPLWASAATVGTRIHRAMRRGEAVVYTPGFWFWIMLVIRTIPEFVFKRLGKL